MSTPTSTYRLQINSDFTFADAAAAVPYLATLGVSHLYLSPILQAAPGSMHGYDVVDHTRISVEAGGADGLAALVAAAHDHGLGVVADSVPNHMAVPSPAWHNPVLWSVLAEGPESPYADWFDVEGGADAQLLMPVLGDPLADVLDRGELSVDQHGHDERPVLRYFDHEFPLATGTERLPLPELLAAQHYRLAWWRAASEQLNYRRFFDVDTLIAIKVERPDVFEHTHRVLLDLVADGSLDGLRIDHVDGLADPAGYLARLRAATDAESRRTWIPAEKILERDEELPADWVCDGTTGYDALQRITGQFVSPAAADAFNGMWRELAGAEAAPGGDVDPDEVEAGVVGAKREILTGSLAAEVSRLVRETRRVLPPSDDLAEAWLRAAIVEFLAHLDVYRSYVVPGTPASRDDHATVERALAAALPGLTPPQRAALRLVGRLALGTGADGNRPHAEPGNAEADLLVRLQQTGGAAMAKGKEDTYYYRFHRLDALCEVGGDPAEFGTTADALHLYAGDRARHWPASMTTLSTHDTKRSADVRIRQAVLTQRPDVWSSSLARLRQHTRAYRPALVDGPTEYLLWQTLIGAYDTAARKRGDDPLLELDRLRDYLIKSMREAKRHTAWTDGDETYEAAVLTFAAAVREDTEVRTLLAGLDSELVAPVHLGTLGQLVLALTLPGIPDVYQGTELVDLSLVDPDNRRPVDLEHRAQLLAELDAGREPETLDEHKLWWTSRLLRLRRDRPEPFAGGYEPVPAPDDVVAFVRGGAGARVAILVSRRETADLGSVQLPPGRWTPLRTDDVVSVLIEERQ